MTGAVFSEVRPHPQRQKRKIEEVMNDDELVIVDNPTADSKGKKQQRGGWRRR